MPAGRHLVLPAGDSGGEHAEEVDHGRRPGSQPAGTAKTLEVPVHAGEGECVVARRFLLLLHRLYLKSHLSLLLDLL